MMRQQQQLLSIVKCGDASRMKLCVLIVSRLLQLCCQYSCACPPLSKTDLEMISRVFLRPLKDSFSFSALCTLPYGLFSPICLPSD